MRTEVIRRRDINNRSLTIHQADDVEDILEHNKVLRELPQKSDWGRHIASVPNVILVKWFHEAWARGVPIRWGSKEFDALVRAKLNDPDYKAFRVDK